MVPGVLVARPKKERKVLTIRARTSALVRLPFSSRISSCTRAALGPAISGYSVETLGLGEHRQGDGAHLVRHPHQDVLERRPVRAAHARPDLSGSVFHAVVFTYSGSRPGIHLMPQPLLGFWSAGTGVPSSTASSAARRSASRKRDAISRPAPVHLSAIDELPRPVEKEEIGGARGVIRAGRLLRFVVQVRKAVADRHCLPRHHLRTILGMAGHVVGADADRRQAATLVVLHQPRQLLLHVLDVGAMIAEEHDEKGGSRGKIVPRHRLSRGRIGKGETGAGVPRGSIVDSAAMMLPRYKRSLSAGKRKCIGCRCLGRIP